MSNYIQNRPNQPLLGQALYEEILSRFQTTAAAGKTPVAGANGTIGSDWLPVVPISKGGTGAANAAQALANLGGMSSSGGTFSGRTQFTATGGAIAATSVIGQAQFNSGNSASAAAITLNHSGYYLNFGVDTDNVLKVGGGSMGNVAYPILHSGNWSQYISVNNGPLTPSSITWQAIPQVVHAKGCLELPSGGTWAYVWFHAGSQLGPGDAMLPTLGMGGTGVAAGGTLLGRYGDYSDFGFCWRIS